MRYLFLFLFFLGIFLVSNAYAAHYVVGYVNDAVNGDLADGHTVTLWNSSADISDNVSDIIGPAGNSGVSNIFMIDCEMLSTPCEKNDIVSVGIVNIGDNYASNIVNVTLSGAGYDVAENLTLNSPPYVFSVFVDDALSSPEDEIDLVIAGNRTVYCEGYATEYEGDGFQGASAVFFDGSASDYDDGDDNNYHYSNQSCLLNLSYGNENQTYVLCSFNAAYYANSGDWNCTINVENNDSLSGRGGDDTFINTLLGIGIEDSIDYGVVDIWRVSNESVLNVTNYGNVKVNLSLMGFAVSEGDGYAMNCSSGRGGNNISVSYEGFNLTASTPGDLNFSEFESHYTELNSSFTSYEFNLTQRIDDDADDSERPTYWRIYLPTGVTGETCTGNIKFGATLG